jgi:hypothetical protein
MRFVVENGFCQDRLMKRSIDLRQAAADGLHGRDKMEYSAGLGGDLCYCGKPSSCRPRYRNRVAAGTPPLGAGTLHNTWACREWAGASYPREQPERALGLRQRRPKNWLGARDCRARDTVWQYYCIRVQRSALL